MNTPKKDFAMESRLKSLDPDLHRHFTNTVVSMQYMLDRFLLLFPEFTDHSALHSMTVLDFCNLLIGPDQLSKLSADAIYTLMMACYLHDIGMGITQEQFAEFRKEIPFGDYFEKHPDATMNRIIRDFHEEFSAAFIHKYAQMLEIPSPEHEFALVQVCRGHRHTNLFDAQEFPEHFTVNGDHEIPLPYLAALIRLADEIDVSATRNPLILYDTRSMQDDHEIAYHKRHQAVKDLTITEDAFLLHAVHMDSETDKMVDEMIVKLQNTLDYCRRAVRERSPFRISQKEIRLLY